MTVLTQKTYKNYDRISRYSSFPYYYNNLDSKYMYSTSLYLDNTTQYSNYKVARGDTYDSIALAMYNNPTYFWIICDFNRILDPFNPPKEDTTLKIPVISTLKYSTIRK